MQETPEAQNNLRTEMSYSFKPKNGQAKTSQEQPQIGLTTPCKS